MQEEVKHYKVKSLGTKLRPNSVYYVKPNSQTAVLTYITDQTGVPYPLIDLTGAGNIQTVTGTGVTGTLTNPVINISTFKSSQLGNLIELSSADGKLFVKPITSPSGSIRIVSTLSELQIELSEALQEQIQSAIQPGDNVSELTNDAGYITLFDIPSSNIAATVWTANHTTATENPYLAGTVVYYSGHIFKAKFNNDSIEPAIGGNVYWEDLGVGYFMVEEQADWSATSGSTFIKNRPTNISSFTNDVGYITQDDVKEYTNLASFPVTGIIGTIYIDLETGLFYSWDGTNYIPSSAPDTGITGVGTIDRIAKFTPTGAQIGNSNIYEDASGKIRINGNNTLLSGTTFLSIQRGQSQLDFALGNPQFPSLQPNEIISDNNISLDILSRGEIGFKVGNTYANEGLRIFSSGKLKFTQTPDTGSTSDKIIVRDSLGEVKQIDYPTIPTVGTWGTLDYPTWTTGTPFVKMTAAGTFALDTNTYLTGITSSDVTTALGYTPVTNARTLTINGTTFDLTADRTWTISSPGGLPTGGTAGQILTKVDGTDYNATWQENYADWTSVVKHIVKNNGVSGTITKGTAVYVTGADGTNMLVGRASNTSEATSSKTMGLMQSDVTTTGGTQTGFVITEGLLGGLNTAGTTAGDPVWLGVNGALIYGLINKPYAPAHLVFIGIVTKVSAGSGEIFVKVQNGFELNEIHDIDLKTNLPTNNQLLSYTSATQLWKNKSLEEIGGVVNLISDGLPGTPMTVAASLGLGLVKSYLIPANTFSEGDMFDMSVIGSKVGVLTGWFVRVYTNTTNTNAGAIEIARVFTNNGTIIYLALNRIGNFTTSTNLRMQTSNSGTPAETNLTSASTNTTFNTAVDNYLLFNVSPATGGTGDLMNIEKVIITKTKYKTTV